MSLKVNDRVRLTPTAAERFPELRGLVGIAATVTGSVVAILWPGRDWAAHFKAEDVEAAP